MEKGLAIRGTKERKEGRKATAKENEGKTSFKGLFWERKRIDLREKKLEKKKGGERELRVIRRFYL